MVEAEVFAVSVLNLFEVALGPIEKTLAQWDLFVLVLSGAVEVPSVVGCFVVEPLFVSDPKDQRGRCSSAGDFTLEIDHLFVQVGLEPFACSFWVERVNAALQSGNDERHLIKHQLINAIPRGRVKAAELADADYFVRGA